MEKNEKFASAEQLTHFAKSRSLAFDSSKSKDHSKAAFQCADRNRINEMKGNMISKKNERSVFRPAATKWGGPRALSLQDVVPEVLGSGFKSVANDVSSSFVFASLRNDRRKRQRLIEILANKGRRAYVEVGVGL